MRCQFNYSRVYILSECVRGTISSTPFACYCHSDAPAIRRSRSSPSIPNSFRQIGFHCLFAMRSNVPLKWIIVAVIVAAFKRMKCNPFTVSNAKATILREQQLAHTFIWLCIWRHRSHTSSQLVCQLIFSRGPFSRRSDKHESDMFACG